MMKLVLCAVAVMGQGVLSVTPVSWEKEVDGQWTDYTKWAGKVAPCNGDTATLPAFPGADGSSISYTISTTGEAHPINTIALGNGVSVALPNGASFAFGALPEQVPCQGETASPTTSPTSSPTVSPTSNPTRTPTLTPTLTPTITPTLSPTAAPTAKPTSGLTGTYAPGTTVTISDIIAVVTVDDFEKTETVDVSTAENADAAVAGLIAEVSLLEAKKNQAAAATAQTALVVTTLQQQLAAAETQKEIASSAVNLCRATSCAELAVLEEKETAEAAVVADIQGKEFFAAAQLTKAQKNEKETNANLDEIKLNKADAVLTVCNANSATAASFDCTTAEADQRAQLTATEASQAVLRADLQDLLAQLALLQGCVSDPTAAGCAGAKEKAQNEAGASKNSDADASSGSESELPLIPIAAAAAVIIIIVVLVAARSGGGGGGGGGGGSSNAPPKTMSFENPMYDGGPTGGSNPGGYLDVAPQDEGEGLYDEPAFADADAPGIEYTGSDGAGYDEGDGLYDEPTMADNGDDNDDNDDDEEESSEEESSEEEDESE